MLFGIECLVSINSFFILYFFFFFFFIIFSTHLLPLTLRHCFAYASVLILKAHLVKSDRVQANGLDGSNGNNNNLVLFWMLYASFFFPSYRWNAVRPPLLWIISARAPLALHVNGESVSLLCRCCSTSRYIFHGIKQPNTSGFKHYTEEKKQIELTNNFIVKCSSKLDKTDLNLMVFSRENNNRSITNNRGK